MNRHLSNNFMSTNLLRILQTITLTFISFFLVTCIVSCVESETISKIADTIRSASHIEIEPQFNFLMSLHLAVPFNFSSNTMQRMGLPNKVVISDVNKIEQIAEFIENSGFIKKWFEEYPDSSYSLTVRFFHDNHMIGSFQMNGALLYIPMYGTLQTSRPLEDLQREFLEILPCEQVIEKIIQRGQDMHLLGVTLLDITKGSGDTLILKDKWCSYIEEYISTYVEKKSSELKHIDSDREMYEDMMKMSEMIDFQTTTDFAKLQKTELERIFSLHSLGPPRCPYALNSQYENDLPEDTIVLFETEPGWNKSGGPELLSSSFTDPNGCFLYLKDDRVEFISNAQIERIKEEAQRLALKGHSLEFRFSNLLKIIEPEKIKENMEK